jgi:hypothetical protein
VAIVREGDGKQKHAFGQLRKIRFADRLKANELLGIRPMNPSSEVEVPA